MTSLVPRCGASFPGSDRTYGGQGAWWRDLLTEGISCGLHRIERLMRLQALKARPRRRRLPPDLGERQAGAVAPNVLGRSFEAAAPNRKWIADFTYVWTAEGWLFVAAVIDLFSRRVVGWSMSAGMTAQLVTDALVMAIWRRGKPDALLHHSDRGSQYSSEQFQRLILEHGIVCSMSRSGNVWDNAAMESFFSSLKTERTARKCIARATRPGRCVRLYRTVLQSEAQALENRISQPYGVRDAGWSNLSTVSSKPGAGAIDALDLEPALMLRVLRAAVDPVDQHEIGRRLGARSDAPARIRARQGATEVPLRHDAARAVRGERLELDLAVAEAQRRSVVGA